MVDAGEYRSLMITGGLGCAQTRFRAADLGSAARGARVFKERRRTRKRPVSVGRRGAV